MEALAPRAHERAAEAFAERATDAFGETIRELVVYGSTVRGDTRGRDSDVDVFVVVDDADAEGELRDIAYDVSLEHGVTVSLLVESSDEFERRRDHPFVRTVLREGRSYV